MQPEWVCVSAYVFRALCCWVRYQYSIVVCVVSKAPQSSDGVSGCGMISVRSLVQPGVFIANLSSYACFLDIRLAFVDMQAFTLLVYGPSEGLARQYAKLVGRSLTLARQLMTGPDAHEVSHCWLSQGHPSIAKHSVVWQAASRTTAKCAEIIHLTKQIVSRSFLDPLRNVWLFARWHS